MWLVTGPKIDNHATWGSCLDVSDLKEQTMRRYFPKLNCNNNGGGGGWVFSPEAPGSLCNGSLATTWLIRGVGVSYAVANTE